MPIVWMWSPHCDLFMNPLTATQESKLRISARGSVCTLSKLRMTGIDFRV